jgi:ketosteroid isomerase-like protein
MVRPSGRCGALRQGFPRRGRSYRLIAMDPTYTDKLLTTLTDMRKNDSSENEAILQGVYAGLVKGDYEPLHHAAADEIELCICGFEPLSGKWRGRKEVIEATKANFGRVENQKPVVEGFISGRDCVAVLMHEKGVVCGTGEHYSVRVVQWVTFANGKITKVEQIVASV